MKIRWTPAAAVLALSLGLAGTAGAGEAKQNRTGAAPGEKGTQVETQAGRQEKAATKQGRSGEKSLQSLSCPEATLLQASLKRHGAYEGEITGKIDEQTRKAFHDYQRMLGVQTSDRIDERTASLLDVQAEEIQPVRGLDYTDDPQVIRALKLGLIDRGLYDGAVNGEVTPEFRASVRKFQEMHGLEPTGLLTRYTVWRLLPAEAEAPAKPGPVLGE